MYTGLTTTTIKHEALDHGTECPDCLSVQLNGKVYNINPGVVISLSGHPPITGDKFIVEKLRCNLCSKIFTPKKYKDKLQKLPKYNASCSVTLAMNKYQLGGTFSRIEKIQSMVGIPLATSTQWDLVNELSYRIEPVVSVLENLAAQSNKIYFDDSPHRILSNKNRATTTAIIAEIPDYRIKLFYTGFNTAGKNVTKLLSNRKTTESLLTMSDALGNNFSSKMPLNIFSKLVVCFCLVHGRRYFYKLLDFFKIECDFVLDCISKVYEAEKFCKENNLPDNQRLKYHRQHSLQIMSALRTWLINQLKFKSGVEQNSPLGQAISYMLKNWPAITRFLTYPGAQLDNNICERLIKVSILHRKNSLFYRTSRGAKVGSAIMSIIQTCSANNINPYNYLVYLHDNHELVRKNPAKFLPWNYMINAEQDKHVA